MSADLQRSNKPPMNEQRSTDDIILYSSLPMHPAAHQITGITSIPDTYQQSESTNIQRKPVHNHFANFSGLRAIDKIPSIGRNLDGSISPGTSLSPDGRKAVNQPGISLSVDSVSNKSPPVAFQIQIQNINKQEALPSDAPPKVYNFTQPELVLPQKQEEDKDCPESNGPSGFDEIKVRTELETEKPSHAQPQIGIIDFNKRKKAKKRNKPDVLQDTENQKDSVAVPDHLAKPAECFDKEQLQLEKVEVAQSAQEPIVKAKLQNFVPENKTKKGKKKFGINIEIFSEALKQVDAEKSEPVISVPQRPTQVIANNNNNNAVSPGQDQKNNTMDKSALNSLLDSLEKDISPTKIRKKVNKDEHVIISSTRPGPLIQQNFYVNDLDNEFIKALKRNNSDSLLNKNELKSKRMILRDLQDLKESFLQMQDQDKSEIDIGFLHASPIFTRQLNETKTLLVALKFQDEKKAIVEAIKSSGNKIKFRQSVATKDKFIEMIRKKPRCLHISCHGIDQTQKHNMKLVEKKDMQNLLFESENGDGVLMSQRELSKILRQATTKIQLVFVAACMSQFVGEIFQECDVPHVICSKQGTSILDQAAIRFTKFFYSILLSGETICQAFQQAKNEVSILFNEKEADHFQILISNAHGQPKHSAKNCNQRWPIKSGGLDCRSDHIKFKSIRSKTQNFIPREIEFSKLVTYLQDTSKLVHFRGLPGIGKTTLTKNVLHYLSERKHFSGGILYETLNNVKKVHSFLLALLNRSIQFFNLTPQQKFELTHNGNDNVITDFMISLFDDKVTSQYQLKKQKYFNQSKDRRFLLVLDNAEMLIDESGEEFRSLLSIFTDSCKQLKILVISRNELGSINENELISPLILPQLGSKQAVHFFLDVIGEEKRDSIKTEEIVDLILECRYYPVHKIFPNLSTLPKEIDAVFKADFHKQIEDLLKAKIGTEKLVEIFSYHDLFRLLQGNPTSLSRAAYVYVDPFINSVQTLSDLYKMVKQNNFASEEDSGAQKGDEIKPKPRLNNESLEATTKMAIGMLPSSGAKSLLYFIGCLPAGVTLKQLQRMWGESKVKKDLPMLQKFNLVENSEAQKGSSQDERYELSTVLYQFIIQDIAKESYENFMNEIISFYTEMLKEYYREVSIRQESEQDSGSVHCPDASAKKLNFLTTGLVIAEDRSGGMSIDQLNQLHKGVSMEKPKNIKSSLYVEKMLSSKTAYTCKEVKIQQEFRNLACCMEFLLAVKTEQSDAPFLENLNFSGQDLNNSGSNSSALSHMSNQEGRNVFANTSNRKDLTGSIVLQEMINHSIRARRPSPRRPKNEINHRKRLPVVTKQNSGSDESSSGFTSDLSEILKQQGTMRRQTAQPQRRSELRNKRNSKLYVIEEIAELPFATLTSQQTEQQDSMVKLNEVSIPLQKQDSSPFQISSVPLETFTSNSKEPQNSDIYKASTNLGKKAIETFAKINQDIKSKFSYLNLSSTIRKCDEMLIEQSKKRESLKNISIYNLYLDPIVKNVRQINETDVSSSSQSSSEEPESQNNFQELLWKEQKDQSHLQDIHISNVQSFKGINVKKWNLKSERTDPIDSESKCTEPILIDPMGSVREGDDFESQASDFDHSFLRHNQQNIMEDGPNQPRPSFEKSNSASQGINLISTNFKPQTERQHHTTNTNFIGSTQEQRGQGKTGLFASVANPKMEGLFKKVTDGFQNKNSKLIKQLRYLDKSARFTLRASNRENGDRRGSKVFLPNKKKTEKYNSVVELYSKEKKNLIKEKMSVYEEFIVYAVSNTFLMDDFAFSYQISSTNFGAISNSLLFKGNILRFKGLSAEQIFRRYFDIENQEINFPIIAYLIEACETAKEELDVYKAEIDGEKVGYANKYGMGLANFHLGYLFEKYASFLSSSLSQAMHSEVFYHHKSENDYKVLALKHFKEAYRNFDEMVHLKGMYLAKEHEANLCESLSESMKEYDTEMEARARKMAKLHKQDYFQIVNTQHLMKSEAKSETNSVHIPRQHGEEISLLTEIVQSNFKRPLFRKIEENKQTGAKNAPFKRVTTIQKLPSSENNSVFEAFQEANL